MKKRTLWQQPDISIRRQDPLTLHSVNWRKFSVDVPNKTSTNGTVNKCTHIQLSSRLTGFKLFPKLSNKDSKSTMKLEASFQKAQRLQRLLVFQFQLFQMVLRQKLELVSRFSIKLEKRSHNSLELILAQVALIHQLQEQMVVQVALIQQQMVVNLLTSRNTWSSNQLTWEIN